MNYVLLLPRLFPARCINMCSPPTVNPRCAAGESQVYIVSHINICDRQTSVSVFDIKSKGRSVKALRGAVISPDRRTNWGLSRSYEDRDLIYSPLF